MIADYKNAKRKKLVDADNRAAFWLAEANEAREKGRKAREGKCLAKCEFWLDRANKLRGDA